ncbi:hypothetical protein C0995_013148 [Termitomyces sp. Mi166|nr:hypothetical protein C0995_013148 [Termitomyces sp. Mi166\
MDKFATLEPVRLYASSGARLLRSGTAASKNNPPAPVLIGRLPADLHQLILSFLPIPDVPAYVRSSRALNSIAKDDKFWDARWSALGIEKHGLEVVLDTLENAQKGQLGATRSMQPPTISVSNDDDFGDFATAEPVAGFGVQPPLSLSFPIAPTKRTTYARAHNLLKPLALALHSTAPHLILSTLSTFFVSPQSLLTSPAPQNQTDGLPLRTRAKALHLLALFLSPAVQPLRSWSTLRQALQTAMDRFDAGLLAAFDSADGRGDEEGMREAAESSWEVWTGNAAEWEMGKMWAEKREIFYVQGQWDPLANFTADGALDFDAMDEFMGGVLKAIEEHGLRAVRVFPPAAQVLVSFSERVANDVVGEYITALLTQARAATNSFVFLQATAASFKEAWRMVDVLLRVAQARAQDKDIVKPEDIITTTKAEDVVYQMFESNMDEYLDEEVESVKNVFNTICKAWDRELATYAPTPSTNGSGLTSIETQQYHNEHTSQPRFLTSQNPAQVKRNVLASFTSVLLLPVTIVPRTVGAVGGAIVSGGTAAVQGIAMLNPTRWGGSAGAGKYGGGVSKTGWGANGSVYRTAEAEGSTVFEVGDADVDADEDDGKTEVGDERKEADAWGKSASGTSMSISHLNCWLTSADYLPVYSAAAGSRASPSPTVSSSTSRTLVSSSSAPENKLELLLSLDVALEMIHADREPLKRVETFAGYPGHYGHRVRDTIEELFILMLGALGDEHLRKGFAKATEQMREYKPAEHEATTSVAPLLQFFELVHIGDTIQSMVQVYFDKELAHHIDRTDFLNAVVREKKRFENALDDSVAGGLNAGTEVLMNQVEHILVTLTSPREYYPEDGPLDLGPTRGCSEAIKCLEMHCKLLKGSTSKEVLEVFYQEVGIRLIAVLQKHIKRQIISLNGGFRVIADLNTYYTFVSSLKIPSIISDFSHLKMLGHVYVVEDAKDLAQIVRDVTRYGGAYRPEDVYEFIQRRSDWKKIEKTVDKTMYNLSFKEDCVVC